MKALVIFSHPNQDSFNGAVLKTVQEALGKGQHEVKVKDLYRMNWNPLLSVADLQQLYSGSVPDDIAAEQKDVSWADMLIFIYPIWWFQQPAILKGWIDRVFSHGFAYRQTPEGAIEGLLRGRRAVIITTSGADEQNMKQNGILDAINISMVKGTLGFSGITDVVYKNLYAVPAVTDDDRKKMLQDVADIF